MCWNDKGEVVKEDGTVLRGSHIADFIRDMVYSLKIVDVPGQEYIRLVIRKLYIPRSLVYMPRLDIDTRFKCVITSTTYTAKPEAH